MSTEKTISVEFSGGSRDVSFFLDDSIGAVRQKIGIAVGIHPDRLRIYVEGQFPKGYYAKDSRKWEGLFLRLSPRGDPITPAAKSLYTPFPVPIGDKVTWMGADAAAPADFEELRILGVPEDSSYVFPMENVDPPLSLPERAVLPELTKLFQTMHPYPVAKFVVVGYTPGLKSSLQMMYFPMLRETSSATVCVDIVNLLQKETKLLRVLAGLKVEEPSKISILRARWKLSWVDTEFGSAIRNRFEQIFYSQTVDESSLPVVSYFTSNKEASRHKFFTDNKSKTPTLDLKLWNSWWNASKPVRNRPSLVFFRGTSRTSYDRITITSTDAILTSYRSSGDATIETMQKNLAKWLASMDALTPFIDPKDTDKTRWQLLDTSVHLEYETAVPEADFRRFECINSLFEIVKKDDLVFKFIRSDQSDIGLTEEEIQVLTIVKENPAITAAEIDLPDAAEVLASVRDKLEEDPDLVFRQLVGLPVLRIKKQTIDIVDLHDLPRTIQYISILRSVLSDENEALDAVCPRKKETAQEVAATVVNADDGEYAEFDFLEGIEDVSVNAAPAPLPAEEEEAPKKVKAKTAKPDSTYGYFRTKLQEFDESVYSGNYSSKCEQERQTVVFTSADEARLAGTPYALSTYDSKFKLENENPSGTFLCPKFWCTKDRIPIREEELVLVDGERACPVCRGKIFTKGATLSDAPVIARASSHVFPGFMKKFLPSKVSCCFTTDQSSLAKQKLPAGELETPVVEMSYILSETKELGGLRIGYIPLRVLQAIRLPASYAPFIAAKNRIQTGQTGFFRVGLGKPAKTLPQLLGLTTTIESPAAHVDVLQRCEFFRSWKGEYPADIVDPLERQIAGIAAAFEAGTLHPHDELEYVARLLDCDLFSIYQHGEDVTVGCRFGGTLGMRKAVAILCTETTIDYIAHVSRPGKVPKYTANIFPTKTDPLFPHAVYTVLNASRSKACTEDVPTLQDASRVWAMAESPKPMFVVMDPFRRAQALFVPGKMLLPFRPTSNYTSLASETILGGYSDIKDTDLPTHEQTIALLERARVIHDGYTYRETIQNSAGEQVEGILKSGLRVLFQSEKTEDQTPAGDALAPVKEMSETALAFAPENAEVSRESKAIQYEAEVFDFLLFQLSHDAIKNTELRDALLSRKVETLREPLEEWFERTVKVYAIADPPTFVKKMRTPCSPDACTGSVCAFDGATCKVRVNQVRPSLEKTKLFRRLLSTLLSNQKTWAIVVEHRVSPFFSTMLYVELPHEVVMTDTDIELATK